MVSRSSSSRFEFKVFLFSLTDCRSVIKSIIYALLNIAKILNAAQGQKGVCKLRLVHIKYPIYLDNLIHDPYSLTTRIHYSSPITHTNKKTLHDIKNSLCTNRHEIRASLLLFNFFYTWARVEKVKIWNWDYNSHAQNDKLKKYSLFSNTCFDFSRNIYSDIPIRADVLFVDFFFSDKTLYEASHSLLFEYEKKKKKTLLEFWKIFNLIYSYSWF